MRTFSLSISTFLLAACGGSAGDSAGVTACRAACDVQAADCEAFDVDGCNTVCTAWGITNEGAGCDDLLKAWQDCLADQTYTCFDELAVPEDTEACQEASSAFLESDAC